MVKIYVVYLSQRLLVINCFYKLSLITTTVTIVDYIKNVNDTRFVTHFNKCT